MESRKVSDGWVRIISDVSCIFDALVSETTWFQLRTGRWFSSKVQVIITPPCFQLSEKLGFSYFPVTYCRKSSLFSNYTVSGSELLNNVLRYVISKSFLFPPDIESLTFRELGRCDCSVQYIVLGQLSRSPFNGFPVNGCLYFRCPFLCSKIAAEYNIHKLILKQFDPNRHRTGDLLRLRKIW